MSKCPGNPIPISLPEDDHVVQETARERAIAEAAETFSTKTASIYHNGSLVPSSVETFVDHEKKGAYIAGARAHSLDHPVIAQLEAAIKLAVSYCDSGCVERSYDDEGDLNSVCEDALEALSKARMEGK